MIYTASEIVKRAFQLADIANTDYISHQEAVQYMNDSWLTAYQLVINAGDNIFTKEVDLMNASSFNDYTEYELPDDFYQLKSVKNKYTGSLITRHAESEGINSNSYEIVNDRLRLYGVAQNPLSNPKRKKGRKQ